MDPAVISRPMFTRVALWFLRVLLALPFFLAGMVKLLGFGAMVALFDQIGIGQWFRYLTGSLEVAGALLVLSPRWPWGALILTGVAAGAVVTHLAVIGGNPLPAFILLFLSLLLLVRGRKRLFNVGSGF